MVRIILLFVLLGCVQLVNAQAAVPMAMAEAFRSGNLNILDYYKLQNVSADTEMRKSFAIQTKSDTSGEYTK